MYNLFSRFKSNKLHCIRIYVMINYVYRKVTSWKYNWKTYRIIQIFSGH